MDEEWLTASYYSLRKDSAPGIDQQKWLDYKENLEENIKSLLNRAKSGIYKAPAVLGVEIPKPGSKEKRPIGIPTIEDKVLQKAVHMLLEPVYELEFYPFSFGFRPKKSCHQALEYLWKGIMDNNIQWILDIDIRKFFDTVKHEILRQLLRIRVRDGVIMRLIGKWLKAGVLQDGSIRHRDEGTPQGGTISPSLSNVYLHEVIDKWYAVVARPRLKRRSIMVRYSDDVVLGFESREDAVEVLRVLRRRIEKYGLELHSEKTKLIYFGKPGGKEEKDLERGSFDFLGFTHFWAKSYKGNWVVRRKTSKNKFSEKLKKMNEWCRKNRHLPLILQHSKICRKLKGHYAYYGITGNIMSLQKFLRQVTRIWKKWLNRRSWRGDNLTWDRFNILLKEHIPLPPPKVVHSIYAAKP
jgi:group II intron reverse transcriptase/maturase